MSLQRIAAITIRYFYLIKRDRWHVSEMFYWPFIDVAMYGYISLWVEQGGNDSSTAPILATVVLWQSLIQADYGTSKNALGELWSANLVSLFSSPMSLWEWVAAGALISAAGTIFVSVLCTTLVKIFFGYSMLKIASILPFVLLNLYGFGLAIGLISTSVLFYSGVRAQAMVYMLGWIFSLIGGAYYPAAILPWPMRFVARSLPLSYLFDGIRQYETLGTIAYSNFTISLLLTFFYLVFALTLLRKLFNRTLELGLARLAY